MGDLEEKIAKLREQYLYELSDDGYEVDVIRDDIFDYNDNIDLLFTDWKIPNFCRFQLTHNGKKVYEIITGKNGKGLFARINGRFVSIIDEDSFQIKDNPDTTCRLLRNGLRKRLTLSNNLSTHDRKLLDVLNSSLWNKMVFNGLIRIRDRLYFNIKYFDDSLDAFTYANHYTNSLSHILAFGKSINKVVDSFIWYKGQYRDAIFNLDNNEINTLDELISIKFQEAF